MTAIDHDQAVLVRPQPLGRHDGPAGLLLVPAGDGVAETLAGLAAGHRPDVWPDAMAAFVAAVDGDTDRALSLLGDDTVSVVNRLVLAPTPEHLAHARAVVTGDPNLEVVVASAAYASGLGDEPPTVGEADGEFAVLALTVRAARALEFKDPSGALRSLREAVEPAAAVGPVLQARVLAMVAEHQQQARGPHESVLEAYDQAIRLLTPTDLDELCADLHLERGLVAHQMADEQRHRLVEAIRSYQSALIVLTEERHPERFALANMNVAIAILAMPMSQASDQVRLGVAVQSLRAALRVYRPETHPWEWSSSQMNLANALQYLPSAHREENLQEAVELLEAVLEVRSPRSDPAGYARVLANQANALAHLAVFDHAEAKYREARTLFERVGELDAVDVVDRQLAQIDQQRGAR